MRFEWDEAKNKANQKKHGVAFTTAARVFDDPNFALVLDHTDETEEQRFHAIGDVGATVLLVVHVYRESVNGEEIIRIISARKASEHERGLYFQ